jgi:hypothetical protein
VVADRLEQFFATGQRLLAGVLQDYPDEVGGYELMTPQVVVVVFALG